MIIRRHFQSTRLPDGSSAVAGVGMRLLTQNPGDWVEGSNWGTGPFLWCQGRSLLLDGTGPRSIGHRVPRLRGLSGEGLPRSIVVVISASVAAGRPQRGRNRKSEIGDVVAFVNLLLCADSTRRTHCGRPRLAGAGELPDPAVHPPRIPSPAVSAIPRFLQNPTARLERPGDGRHGLAGWAGGPVVLRRVQAGRAQVAAELPGEQWTEGRCHLGNLVAVNSPPRSCWRGGWRGAETSRGKNKFTPPQTSAPRSCRAGTQRMSFCTKSRLSSRREALRLDPSAAGAGETGRGTYCPGSIARGIPVDGPSR